MKLHRDLATSFMDTQETLANTDPNPIGVKGKKIKSADPPHLKKRVYGKIFLAYVSDDFKTKKKCKGEKN